jgi:hypothetical protein
MFARKKLEAVPEDRRFLCGPFRDITSRIVVRQWPAGKYMSMEAEVVVEIRHNIKEKHR